MDTQNTHTNTHAETHTTERRLAFLLPSSHPVGNSEAAVRPEDGIVPVRAADPLGERGSSLIRVKRERDWDEEVGGDEEKEKGNEEK